MKLPKLHGTFEDCMRSLQYALDDELAHAKDRLVGDSLDEDYDLYEVARLDVSLDILSEIADYIEKSFERKSLKEG